MKTAIYKSVDEKEVLDKVFCFLVKKGLESASIREICRGTGLTQGSLYYWLSDKTTIICEATEFGLKKVTDEIFNYVFLSLGDLDKFFDECLDKISAYRDELRFIYQMAASPVYGEKIRSDGKYFRTMYDKYAIKLAEFIKCDVERLKPIVYILVSAVCDYAIWGDKNTAQKQIDFVHSILPQVIGSAEGIKL